MTFFIAGEVYHGPSTYSEFQKRIKSEDWRGKLRYGSFEYRFRDMVENSSQDGAMTWCALHFWEFPENVRPQVMQAIFDFANYSRRFREYLETIDYFEARREAAEKVLQREFRDFDSAFGNVLAAFRFAKESEARGWSR